MSSLFIQLAFAGFLTATDQLAASRGIVTLISSFTSTGGFELEKLPTYDPSVIGRKAHPVIFQMLFSEAHGYPS